MWRASCGARQAASILCRRRILDPERINVYERWESDDDLHRFRSPGGPELELPPLRFADVRKYRIASVEEP